MTIILIIFMLLVFNSLVSSTLVLATFKIVSTKGAFAGILLHVRSYILLNTAFYVFTLGQKPCHASVMFIFDLTEV